jgi:hypothetical protein
LLGAAEGVEVVTLAVGLEQTEVVETLFAAKRIDSGDAHAFDPLARRVLGGIGQAAPAWVAEEQHVGLAVAIAQGELVGMNMRLPGDVLGEGGKRAGNGLEAPDIGAAKGLNEPLGGLAEVGADVEDHRLGLIDENALEIALELEAWSEIAYE